MKTKKIKYAVIQNTCHPNPDKDNIERIVGVFHTKHSAQKYASRRYDKQPKYKYSLPSDFYFCKIEKCAPILLEVWERTKSWKQERRMKLKKK